MPRVPDYRCTRCGVPTKRSKLTVKKALFTEMGEGASTVRSRVIDWLCPACRDQDSDFLREKFAPPRIEVQQVATTH